MSEGTDYLPKTPINELVAAAHELKTPLSIIAHLASAVEDESLGLTPSERRVALERIRLSADRTLRLVQGLTTAYRLDEGNQLAFKFELEPLNISQVCEEVAHEIVPFAAQHGQTLSVFNGVRRTQLVVANNELLRSVLFNLMDNAIKHNPPQTTVGMTLRKRQDRIRICVQDSGPGFNRGDFATLRNHLGKQLMPLAGRSSSSGLGLYIASQMATAMGGRLGVGTTRTGADFHVDLLQSNQLSFI